MRRTLPALLAALALVAACDDKADPTAVSAARPTTTDDATSSSGSTPPSDSTAPSGDPFDWQAFGQDGTVQTGHLEVPRDYTDPSKGTFDLYVARHLADPAKRIGSLLVNPGGPGFGGSDFALYADQVYSQTLLDHFDIVGWDPRGTGLSEPAIDCISDYDHFFAGTDITPDDDAERQQLIDLAKEFADDCVKQAGDFMQYVGTNNSARDMDSIRRALGEETISYFGFSYGSELGATWATLFPSTVRAAVLDGAVDPKADFETTGLEQAAGFEGTLTTFLAQCSADAQCAFHNGGDAEGAFDKLMVALDNSPIPSQAGRPDITRGMALTAVAQAMYDQSYWPLLGTALSKAQQGDGSGLLQLFDDYFERQGDGSYPNSLEAFQVISCMDTSERPTVAEEDALAPEYQRVAPRYSPGTTGSYFCTFFPKSTDPRVSITGAGAGPILVMGTTGDPATPLASTEAMAAALQDGRLVIVKADQHTGYGVNQCSYDVVDQYLVDPAGHAPANGTRCD